MNHGWTTLVSHYERCFAQFGASPRGVDWPNGPDLEARFSTLLSVLDHAPSDARPVLLDVGCGPGLLLDYLQATGRLETIDYRGVDLSPIMVQAAQERWPGHDFAVRDIIAHPFEDRSVDVVIMNGVLTEKLSLPQDAMIELAQGLVKAAFDSARVGIAFNVMSAHVDWQRPDLFHWSFDAVATFLKASVSPNFAFRSDYGSYDYATFVWRAPRRHAALTPAWWER